MDEIIHLQEDSYTPINSSDNYKFSSEFQNIAKKETQNDLINEKNEKNFLQIFNITQKEKDDNNVILINKNDRKRRIKKNNESERKYQCPECDKNYLS